MDSYIHPSKKFRLDCAEYASEGKDNVMKAEEEKKEEKEEKEEKKEEKKEEYDAKEQRENSSSGVSLSLFTLRTAISR